ncbi:serine hydrolase [Streptomyces sp. HNM0574]|uniref:D-alanyl-D-alanine carboxypeptidase family protein n=1 Tax=Streptomyces sp. HNM0574 TaxID=2714954 RepID=UPI00146B0C3E|nr:serine hydrolase [Streptomyces sp. HNM0574]NLU68531.1 D-alanyl-D-alanine carboxypeptidase [Streptomyces sp. HNM0574]
MKGRRRVYALVSAGTVLAAGTFGAAGAVATQAPEISAKGGYVMNDGSGEELFSKSADTRRSTGSTTKVMTAKVVLEQKNLDLDKKVTIQKAYSDYIVGKTGSSARLIVGDKVTVRQLLYGMMLPSGCDAAYALADTYGSGASRSARVKSFIGKMNDEAGELGLKNTNFDSFDGIGNGANYSTPRDLTKLASSAMQNPTFRDVVQTKSVKEKVDTKNGGYRYMEWENTNSLLSTYQGTLGIKTGSGPASGYSLVFAAERNGKTVAGTVLGAPSAGKRTADAKRLLDDAFEG